MKTKYISLLMLALLSWAQLFAQESLTTLPFELYGDHIFIKLKVNNSRDLDFIFDTGDGLTVLNIETARELSMESGSDAHTESAEGTISGKLLKHQKIEINNLELKNLKIYETSLLHLERSIGRNIDGIIGYDILANYVVAMSFDQMQFQLYDASGSYPKSGTSFPINLTSAIPHIKGNVQFSSGESIEGEFFINTGAKTSVDFNTHFVDSNEMIGKVGDSYIYLVAGLGDKEYEHHRGRIQKFSIGDYMFDNMPVGLSRAPSGIQNHKKAAGIIGSSVLRKFNIVFDYKSQKMYWDKSKSYDAAFPVNSSGLELQLDKSKSKVLVHKVFENGVGKKAGIELNDEITQVNGKSASELGLAELRKIFSQSGSSVKVTISRNGSEQTFDLTLESMI